MSEMANRAFPKIDVTTGIAPARTSEGIAAKTSQTLQVESIAASLASGIIAASGEPHSAAEAVAVWMQVMAEMYRVDGWMKVMAEMARVDGENGASPP